MVSFLQLACTELPFTFAEIWQKEYDGDNLHLISNFPKTKELIQNGPRADLARILIGRVDAKQEYMATVRADITPLANITNSSSLLADIISTRLLSSILEVVAISLDGGPQYALFYSSTKIGSEFSDIFHHLMKLKKSRKGEMYSSVDVKVEQISEERIEFYAYVVNFQTLICHGVSKEEHADTYLDQNIGHVLSYLLSEEPIFPPLIEDSKVSYEALIGGYVRMNSKSLFKGLENFAVSFLDLSLFTFADIWVPDEEHSVDCPVHLKHVATISKTSCDGNIADVVSNMECLNEMVTVKAGDGCVGRAYSLSRPILSHEKSIAAASKMCDNANVYGSNLYDFERSHAFLTANICSALSIPVHATEEDEQKRTPPNCILSFYSQTDIGGQNEDIFSFIQREARKTLQKGKPRNKRPLTVDVKSCDPKKKVSSVSIQENSFIQDFSLQSSDSSVQCLPCSPKTPVSSIKSATIFCSIQGCNEPNLLNNSRRQFCAAHSKSRKCEHPSGCVKNAQGLTRFCIAHGGGRRCSFPGCDKGARDRYFCTAHGGGKRCNEPNCNKAACGGSVKCTAHGGGKRCHVTGCNKGAQASTNFCVKHGGGRKCSIVGCVKVARGRTNYCARHGGGVRCRMDGCNRVAIGKRQLCRAHGQATVRTSEIQSETL